MERDEKKFSLALENGDNYVWIDLKTGKIKGRSKTTVCVNLLPEKERMYEMMTLGEYAWLTDNERVTKIVTAADLYDSVEWTSKGFRTADGFVPVPKRE